VPTTVMALAYHAAGHAVANIVQGLDLHPVSVPVDGVHNGVVADHAGVGELRANHRLDADTQKLSWPKPCGRVIDSCERD
jgi:hypothetical protein